MDTVLTKARRNRERNQSVASKDGPATVDDLDTLIAQGLKYRAIYADPPWRYGNQGTRAATDNHYPTMTVDEIAALPIAQLAADAAHLHLWTTNAFLFESKRVIEAWGFFCLFSSSWGGHSLFARPTFPTCPIREQR